MIARRVREPEWMDQPGLAESLHREALRGLERINAVSRTTAVLWSALRQLVAAAPERLFRVLDVACGGGDVAAALARRARRKGSSLRIEGCDISPTAVEFARRRAEQEGTDAAFFVHDALRDALPAGYDAVICSLFLHHLSDADAERLLRNMAAAGRAVLVSDLRRTWTGYALAWAGCRLLSRSPVVHTDGPISVRAAFTPDELHDLARRSGLTGATITRHWPQRMLLIWKRP